MTPADITEARGRLGAMYGLNRPVSMSELGKILILSNARPNQTVMQWESGLREISGPVCFAVTALLDGYRPPHLEACLNRRRG